MNSCKRNLFSIILVIVITMVYLIPTNLNIVHAVGNTYYISPTGSDTTGTGTISSPWKTLLKGSRSISAGDTLILRGGTYDSTNASFYPLTGGTAENPITVKAYTNETPIITGSGMYGIVFNIVDNVDYDNNYFIFEGITTDTTIYASPVWIYNVHNIIFRDCTFKNNVGNQSTIMAINMSSDVTIENCHFDTTGGDLEADGQGDGIYVNGSNHVLIQDNYFTKCGHAAVDIKNWRDWEGEVYTDTVSYNCVVRNNTIEQYWGGGIYVIMGSYNCLVEGNNIKYAGEGVIWYPKSPLVVTGEKGIYRNNICNDSSDGIQDYLGSMVTDGDAQTKWISGRCSDVTIYNDPQWIFVDLGASYNINRVKLNWDAHYSSYKIQTSSDGATWNDSYSTTTGDGSIDDVTFTAVSARYVRMHGTVRADTSKGCSLWEFEVYGTADPSTNLAYNKMVEQSSNIGSASAGIEILGYLYASYKQDAVDNRIYNNTVYNNGRYGMMISARHSTDTSRNKILNNIIYASKTSGPWEAYSPPGYYSMFFENYHAYPEMEWGTNFPNDNYFYNNIILHNDILGDHPNYDRLIFYDGGKTPSTSFAKSLAQTQSSFSSYFYDNIESNPGFADAQADNFNLQSGSAAIDSGSHLTTTTTSGTNTTTVPVNDAQFFCDGYGIITGDSIKIGSNPSVVVTSANYTTNTLTVANPVSFNTGDYVDQEYNGTAPDIGAFESSYTIATPTPVFTSTPTPTPTPTLTPTPVSTSQPSTTQTTLTLQYGLNNYTDTIDVSTIKEYPDDHVSSWMGYFSSGEDANMKIQDDGVKGWNGLIYFDVSDIPDNAIITSAELKMYASSIYGAGTIDLFKITDVDNKGMWIEGNIDPNNQYRSSGASFLKRDGGYTLAANPGWTNVSGSTIMDSVAMSGGTPAASTSTVIQTGSGWISFDLINDIQDFADGTDVNQGWYLRPRIGTSVHANFVTKEGTGVNRPILEVTYTLPATTPAPQDSIWFQNFESGSGFTAGANATTTLSNNNGANSPGTKSVNMTTSVDGNPGTAEQCVNITPQYGTSIDASGYSQLIFSVKDTQGTNTNRVTLIDTSNAVWSGWAGIYNVLNQWTKINVDMSTVTGINKSAIKEIRVGEWNIGTYYIDDVYFAQNVSDPVPSFNANVLTNPGFEADGIETQTPSGWSSWSDINSYDADYTQTNGQSYEGSFHLVHWKDTAYRITTAQTKTNLPNGTYNFTAWVQSSGGQTEVAISAKNYGGTERRLSIGATPSWTQVSISNINVTNGQCQIDIWSDANAGNWFCIDNIELIKQ